MTMNASTFHTDAVTLVSRRVSFSAASRIGELLSKCFILMSSFLLKLEPTSF